MHPNPAFRTKDEALAGLFVREIGFASIFAATPDGPRVAHAPVLLSDEARTLQFHLARGNGLTRHLDGATLLVVVQGPDAYISPGWYSAPDQVPTWNYVAVEMEGRARKLDSEALVAQLDALTAQHEARIGAAPPWTREKMSSASFARMTEAIVGFEMDISAWRPTLKLSQNKPADERGRVIAGLTEQGHGAMAELMRHLGSDRVGA